MSNSTENKGFVTAALVGAGAFLLCMFVLGLNVIVSVVIGVVAFLGMSRVGGSKAEQGAHAQNVAEEEADTPHAEPAPAARTASENGISSETPSEEPAPSPPVTAADKAAQDMAGRVKLGTRLPGEEELAQRRGAWRYEG